MPSEHREQLMAPPTGTTMTIGELSERTGVPVKQLRRYEDLGYIYTVGRSAGNYRHRYLTHPQENVGPRLAERLQAVRDRTNARIDELQQLLGRLDPFEDEHRAELRGETDFRRTDPRFAHEA